jgi:hypothetical protein
MDEDIEAHERVVFLRLQMEFYYKPIWENEDKTFKRESSDGIGSERKVF